ncbi:Ser/Thr protein kinase RdoA (MazF antagonist) [Deinobacterium chartae]|uniref:Ser/Thr protein kinase RdoA (MazF antagonist) n=1 Tax=Deinobacterium chartae TaxID=521158 RepID=A0A841HX72_9DEIO|nr:aminoglycoside phosphotransferase family protein [Deinobacterium chartae]MBB6097516.1 Ser/Thr protein kinase RdoA (MazF antagonist) [Deinobacterium chartae]
MQPDALTLPLLRAVARRHGLPGRRAWRLPQQGRVNAAYLLDERAVLRVPRNDHKAVRELWVEAATVPHARALGLRTPELLALDATLDLLPWPYTVYAFVPGDPAPAWSPPVCRALGHELARLHAYAGPPLELWRPEVRGDAYAALEAAAGAGRVSPQRRAALHAKLAALEAEGARTQARAVLLHNDVHMGNLRVRAGRYAALIDWGDAGWGDVLLELCLLPLAVSARVLSGYLEAGGDPGEAAWARLSWDALEWTLWALARLPEGDARLDSFRARLEAW